MGVLRDSTQTDILEDFYESLEGSLEGKSGESAIYMSESCRFVLCSSRES